MFFIKVLDLSKIPILVLWIVILYTLNLKGFIRKKGKYHLMALITSLFLLMLHVIFNKMPDVTLSPLNIVVDTISMIISSSLYLYTDDIETRREIISGVFENRYKKKRRIK